MSKQFWLVVLVIVAALIGIFAFTGKKAGAPTSSTNQPTNHVEGQGKSGVTLVEYGDYQCPFCGQYFPTVKQVEQTYDSQIHFQFRNYPLVNVHQNAFAGARAAEAAALQDKFWEMHDLLYVNQTTWSTSSNPSQFFDQYASQLGLSVSRFRSDYASTQVNDAINADVAAGNKLGIQGTPTFFLDGKEVQIGNTVDSFKKVLDAEIAKKAPSGTTTSSAGASTTTSQ